MRRSLTLRLVVITSSLLMLLSTGYGALAQGSPASQPTPTADDARAPARGVIVDLSTGPHAGGEALPALERVTADDRTPQVIIGDDGRQPVVDSTQLPYSAVAVTLSYSGTGDDEVLSECTSTFVGPDVLVTSASCLYSSEYGMTNEVVIYPGVNDPEAFPSYETAAYVWMPQPWIDSEDPLYNYALIVMADDELGNWAGWLQLAVLPTETLSEPNLGIHMVSYPTDKPVDTQWESSAPAFVQVDDFLLWHDMDTTGGQSGAAIMRSSDHAIVGIHAGGTGDANLAVRIEEITLADFLDACQDLGCTIDYFIEDTPGPPGQPAGGDTSAFDRTWSRTDYPVASGQVARTWMWGPASFTGIVEEGYLDSPGGKRLVMYFDKSRMEITNPGGDSSSIWYITNGLLVVEMISGNLQLGNDNFEQHQPARINVAGDGDDPNGVTYATFSGLLNAPPITAGSIIDQRVDRNGNVTQDPSIAALGITAGHYVPETNHTIAEPFWFFMNSAAEVWQDGQLVIDDLFENPYFATGYPITEAYWTTVRIGGTPLDVLVQCFERRCLTYNPSNPPAWQVEAGNVGLHYHQWRYELIPSEGQQPPAPPPDNDGAPAEGEILQQADLSTWGEFSRENGVYGEAGTDSYFLGTPAGTLVQNQARAEIGDGSFSVDLRRVEPSASGFGCLVIRAEMDPDIPHQFNTSAYQYCLIYAGDRMVAVSFDYETPEEYINIGYWDIANGELPGHEWYQLKVIAKGGQFWLYLNEVYIGTVTHNGPASGQLGVMAWNTATGGGVARYEFTNLTLRAIH